MSNRGRSGVVRMKKSVVCFRRRCLTLGQGTGLSHYILVKPKKS